MKNLKEPGKRVLRSIFSNFVKFKLIQPPSMRENKISVIIRVKNESDWIEYCLLSFKDFADEILIADHGSTDGSIQIIKDFMSHYPELQIKFFDQSKSTYLEMSNFLIRQTRYRWIMRVDADHVAKTSGKYNILNLKKRILKLDPHSYYGIFLTHINIAMDIFHIVKKHKLFKEIWIYTYSPDLVCYREGYFTDKFWIPFYYKIIEFPEPFVFHLNIKPRKKILERSYWGPWRQEDNKISLSTFINQKIKKDFPNSSLEEAANLYLKSKFKDVELYDPSIHDGYPDILKPEIENPRYKLIYDENGNIIDRIEP